MTDRTHEHNNLPQKDKRANLFYLLQELSLATGTGDRGSEVEAPVSDEQIEASQKRNGIVL
jgi:hypothetical protein